MAVIQPALGSESQTSARRRRGLAGVRTPPSSAGDRSDDRESSPGPPRPRASSCRTESARGTQGGTLRRSPPLRRSRAARTVPSRSQCSEDSTVPARQRTHCASSPSAWPSEPSRPAIQAQRGFHLDRPILIGCVVPVKRPATVDRSASTSNHSCRTGTRPVITTGHDGRSSASWTRPVGRLHRCRPESACSEPPRTAQLSQYEKQELNDSEADGVLRTVTRVRCEAPRSRSRPASRRSDISLSFVSRGDAPRRAQSSEVVD